MADVQIDISKDEDSTFALYSGSIFELTVGSFSVSMNADQFQQLCDNLRPWIVDDAAEAQQPAAAVLEGYAPMVKQYTIASEEPDGTYWICVDGGRWFGRCTDLKDAELILAALKAAQAPPAAVPDGYALVPVEPTEAMVLAGEREMDKHDFLRLGDAYRAMLAAAKGEK